MFEYPSEEAEQKAIESDATALAWLVFDVFRHPEENGIITKDEEKADDTDDTNKLC